jgi:hypothetical protein
VCSHGGVGAADRVGSDLQHDGVFLIGTRVAFALTVAIPGLASFSARALSVTCAGAGSLSPV